MNSFLNLTGVLSEITVFLTLLFCGLKTNKFDFKNETFSHFGSIKATSKIFNTGIFVYLIFRSLFIGRLIGYFCLWNNFIVIITYAVALISIFLAAIFTVREHAFIHFIVTRLAVIVSILFLISLSINFMIKDFNFGVFNFIIFLLLLFVGFLFLLRKKTNAIFQIFFFIPIILWDWVMTVKLFNII